jgi:hypothetical protein
VNERLVPYYCPYCAGEDLRPHGDRHGAWECRECTRVFAVSFLGMTMSASSGRDLGEAALVAAEEE